MATSIATAYGAGITPVHVATNGDKYTVLLTQVVSGVINTRIYRSASGTTTWSLDDTVSFTPAADDNNFVSSVIDDDDKIHIVVCHTSSSSEHFLRYSRFDTTTRTFDVTNLEFYALSGMAGYEIDSGPTHCDIEIRGTSSDTFDQIVIVGPIERVSVMGTDYSRVGYWTADIGVTTTGGFTGPTSFDNSAVTSEEYYAVPHVTRTDGNNVQLINYSHASSSGITSKGGITGLSDGFLNTRSLNTSGTLGTIQNQNITDRSLTAPYYFNNGTNNLLLFQRNDTFFGLETLEYNIDTSTFTENATDLTSPLIRQEFDNFGGLTEAGGQEPSDEMGLYYNSTDSKLYAFGVGGIDTGTESDGDLLVSESTDDGATWDAGTVIDANSIGGLGTTFVTYESSTDTYHIVYGDTTAGSGPKPLRYEAFKFAGRASGTVQSQDASASGAMRVERSASGTVQSQDASTTATSKVNRFASGAPQAQDVSTTATGERIATSSGALQSQDASTTASGERIITSTGTVQSQNASTTATIKLTRFASGTPQAQDASTTATIKLTRFASGAVQSQDASVSSIGEIENTGSGTVVSGDASVTASGVRIVTSTGTVVSQASLVNGVSERTVTSSGTPQAQDASTTATGERIVTSSGAVQSQDANADGRLKSFFFGTGTVQSQSSTVSSSAERIVTSSGTVLSQTAETSGTGERITTASGTVQSQTATVSADTERIVIASGTAESQSSSTSSDAERIVVSSGTVVTSNVSASGIGERIITSTGTVQSQTATVSGDTERIIRGAPLPEDLLDEPERTITTIPSSEGSPGSGTNDVVWAIDCSISDTDTGGLMKAGGSAFGFAIGVDNGILRTRAYNVNGNPGTTLFDANQPDQIEVNLTNAGLTNKNITLYAVGDYSEHTLELYVKDGNKLIKLADASQTGTGSFYGSAGNIYGRALGTTAPDLDGDNTQNISGSFEDDFTGTITEIREFGGGLGDGSLNVEGLFNPVKVESQPATTSGIVERIVKANGVVLSQASSVNGVSERITVSSGTVQSQSASGSGVGERIITSTGTVQSQTALASGVGEIENTGSGAVQSQPSATSGIAERIVKASGTVVSSDASISAVGEIENTASGTPQAQDATASGVGERTVKANGAVQSQEASTTAVGEIENTGSGTPQAQDATTSGVAERKVKSSGNVVSINSNASGTSRRIVTSTGTVQSQESSTTGLINRTKFITASVKSQPATTSSTTKIFRAPFSGTVVSGPATVISKAERIIKASGAVISSDASVLRGRIESLGPEVIEVVIEDNQITVIVSDERSIDVDFINKQVINIFNQENTKQISITFKEKDSFKVG